ncbi:MAG: electron transport complex subunit RsxG [Marinobacter sp.]|nr:electron transport complex subunit RsxG [Marinobacter sp.]
MTPIAQSILRNAIGLGLFAVITAGSIALTQSVTADRIDEQIRRAEAAALFEIIPPSRHDNDLLNDVVGLPDSFRLGHREPVQGHVARQAAQPVGIILPVVTPEGYSGDIRLLVGISPAGEVLGVRVTNHRETPGLGDRVELKKSNWILSFAGRALTDDSTRWAVRKDGGSFDQFTGATITPRAVVQAVYEALRYFEDHGEALLAMPAPSV